ncbi:hypothetical protein BJ912DRAFT_484901 [Pholiota molesta]|nr:hypothetical protein BJ912DRAFT_484901 [Pholiota molesta]
MTRWEKERMRALYLLTASQWCTIYIMGSLQTYTTSTDTPPRFAFGASPTVAAVLVTPIIHAIENHLRRNARKNTIQRRWCPRSCGAAPAAVHTFERARHLALAEGYIFIGHRLSIKPSSQNGRRISYDL